MCSKVTCQGCQRVGDLGQGITCYGYQEVGIYAQLSTDCQGCQGVVLYIYQGPMGLTPGSGVTTCQGQSLRNVGSR